MSKIQDDKLVRETLIKDTSSPKTFRSDVVITKEEFLACYNEWVLKPMQENPVKEAENEKRMKLIIDIPETAYDAYKEWHKNKVATVEQSLIANGKPFVRPVCPLDYPTEDDPYPICPVSEAKWIPVSERTPDYSDWYVVTREVMCHRFMAIVAFDAKYKKWGYGGVVAWIDAKPYKGCGE